jgi:hypothetical protein
MTRTELAAELSRINAMPIPGYDKGIRKQAIVDAKRATWADIAASEALPARDALRIAHAYGLTARQFGSDIRSCMQQARTMGHPWKSPAQMFDGYMADLALERGIDSRRAASEYAQDRD